MHSLTEEAISGHLRALITALQENDVERAQATLNSLGFERLLMPRAGSTSAGRIAGLPADLFGRERVFATARAIAECRRYLKTSNVAGALRKASQASAIWHEASATKAS